MIEQWTDRQNNGGQANAWMDMQYECIHMQITTIFQQILQFLQKRYGPTDQQTDRQMDQQMDIPSYRDAIATSKNKDMIFLGIF